MTRIDNGKKYSLIAGTCFLVFLVLIILNKIFANSGYYITGHDRLAVFAYISILCLAISLFIGNRIVVIVAAGSRVLLSLCIIVTNFRFNQIIMFHSYWSYNGSGCDLIAFAVLIVLLIMSLVGKCPRSKMIWHLAGAIMLGVCIVDWIKAFMDFGWDTYLIVDHLKSTLFRAVEIVALVSSGLWCGTMASFENHKPINTSEVSGIENKTIENKERAERPMPDNVGPNSSSIISMPVLLSNKNEQEHSELKNVNQGCGNDTKEQEPVSAREDPRSTQSSFDDPREKQAVSHSEQIVPTADVAFFCKLCGGNVDKRSRKCTRCGKQYIRVKRLFALLAIGFVVAALAGLNAFQYYYNSNSVQTLKDEVSERDEQIASLVQRISEKDVTISDKDSVINSKDKELQEKDSKIKTQSTNITNLENEVSRLKTEAGYFDEICDAVKAGNLGYASSNFQASESIVVVKKSQTGRKITLTANWSSGGTVEVSYSKSYPSAWIDFDNDSWYTSTTMTIDPNFVGVTVATFSNDVDSKQFSIIIIVTD